MCGVIAIVGKGDISDMIMASLGRLSYRGYDSAGIAVVDGGYIQCFKAPGKLDNLRAKLASEVIKGKVGIGHTRWATHGLPSEIRNAHPHMTHLVAVVHNGIIENFETVRKELTDAGVEFDTDTDSEVIPRLITFYIENLGLSKMEALRKSLARLEGAMSIAAVFSGGDNSFMVAKKSAPLILGYGNGYMFASSDACAIAQWAECFSYLEDGDIAVVNENGVEIFDSEHKQATRKVRTNANAGNAMTSKGEFTHFMLKEICEQPTSIVETLKRCQEFDCSALVDLLIKSTYVRLIGCGSAYYACQVGKWFLERWGRIMAIAEPASEFRYGNAFIDSNVLSIFVSQSGETADTIAAVKHARELGGKTSGIVNVADSTLAELVEHVMLTCAGREVSVATTKAFTAQLVVLYYLATKVSEVLYKQLSDPVIEINAASEAIKSILERQSIFYEAARSLSSANSVIFIGRGCYYAVAQEGALKLREVAYIHAEAIAAGELKHGSIALIDSALPVIAICPSTEHTFIKMFSCIQEIRARSGRVLAVTDVAGANKLDKYCETLVLPDTSEASGPIVYSVAMQLLAYYSGVHRGTDIDQPRNLAKSVTVE